MDRATLELTLTKVRGCTFASIDATTHPQPGITKVTSGRRVILFTNKNVNGYENMVKRRLVEAGKNPKDFVLGDLPWGTKIAGTPLIECHGKTYLQVIELAEGESKYFMLGKEYSPDELNLLERPRASNQGLPEAEEVRVRAYDLESIDRIALMGEDLVSEKRNILRLSV